MLNVLAVDPSLRSTGWATIAQTIDGHDAPRNGLIKIGHRDDPRRMRAIASHIIQTAQRYEARLVALEGASHGSTSSSRDRIDGLHWIIRSYLYQFDIPYIVVAPATIKLYATGFGLAPKRTGEVRGTTRIGMLDAARDDLGFDGLSEDIADATWLHALLLDALGQGYAPDLASPALRAKRRDAIATVVPLLPRNGVLTTPGATHA